MHAKGSFTVVVHVKVPCAATDRVKAAKGKRWVDQTVTIATIDECEHADAASVVARFRSMNKGLNITGQWVGRLSL